MQKTLNSYRLSERELAQAAVHRLNRDPYTLTRMEYKRPLYELTYDQTANLLKIKATYHLHSASEFERKEARNKRNQQSLENKKAYRKIYYEKNKEKIREKQSARYHRAKEYYKRPLQNAS